MSVSLSYCDHHLVVQTRGGSISEYYIQDRSGNKNHILYGYENADKKVCLAILFIF
jgi:hypothetical protein